MNGSFELYVAQDSDLSLFNFKIPIFEWQGVNYPQGPPECKFGSNFILKLLEQYDLPVGFKKKEWTGINVLGAGIQIFIDNRNGFGQEERGFTFKDLLTVCLAGEQRWVAIYSYEYDGYSKVINGDIDDILLSFEKTDEGFLIYK